MTNPPRCSPLKNKAAHLAASPSSQFHHITIAGTLTTGQELVWLYRELPRTRWGAPSKQGRASNKTQ